MSAATPPRPPLARGELRKRYERRLQLMVPAETGEKICQRDPRRVISRQPDAPAAAATGDADDPYAAYQVPDDLIW